MNRDQPLTDYKNRKYALWLGEIGQRAVAAAMKECAYDVIKTKYPPNLYPSLRVSNYDHSNADGKSDTFGWYTGRPISMAPVDPSHPAPSLQPVRDGNRAEPDMGQQSNYYYWNDFIVTSGPQAGRRSLWTSTFGKSTGDFSSPVLYPPHANLIANSQDYYLPPGSPAPDGGRVALQTGRRAVEGILNTPGGIPTSVVPWIPKMGQTRTGNYVWKDVDVRDMFAMLRAKMTREVIVWWSDQAGEVIDWPAHKAIFNRVYDPKIDKIRLLSGSCQNCPAPPQSIQISKLEYTLRETNPSDEYVEILTATPSPTAALQVTFKDLDVQTGPVTINVECTVGSANSAPISQIRGNVYVWNGTTWLLQSIDDYASPTDRGFGFHAPDFNNQVPEYAWNETRRTFDGIQKILVNGKMDIKIVFTRTPGNTAPFTVRYDLVQLIDGDGEIANMMAGAAQGADFNYTQEVSTEDITGFYEAYTAGEPSADFNNDEVVDAQDLAEYTLEYVNPK